jgi:site-specific recombinase XerD
MKRIISTHGIGRLVESYRSYLHDVKGLASRTCASRGRQVLAFVTTRWKRAGGNLTLSRLGGEGVVNYLTRRRPRYKAVTLQYLASTLRCFLRFLILTGQCSPGAVQVVPKIQTGPRVSSPDYLSQAQVEQLLGSFDPQTPVGARDQALVLCLLKLGLRAGEAAQLVLEDLDWRQATLRLIQTKGRQERVLPLPPMVGKALAHYLASSRPATTDRHVFVSLLGGTPLSSCQVSAVVAAALRQAHLVVRRPGAQLLRRSFATHLVQKGATPKEIADLLGHRGLNTLGFYAHVDLPMLQAVVQPWPEVRP